MAGLGKSSALAVAGGPSRRRFRCPMGDRMIAHAAETFGGRQAKYLSHGP